jgi:hypothetical protein
MKRCAMLRLVALKTWSMLLYGTRTMLVRFRVWHSNVNALMYASVSVLYSSGLFLYSFIYTARSTISRICHIYVTTESFQFIQSSRNTRLCNIETHYHHITWTHGESERCSSKFSRSITYTYDKTLNHIFLTTMSSRNMMVACFYLISSTRDRRLG